MHACCFFLASQLTPMSLDDHYRESWLSKVHDNISSHVYTCTCIITLLWQTRTHIYKLTRFSLTFIPLYFLRYFTITDNRLANHMMYWPDYPSKRLCIDVYMLSIHVLTNWIQCIALNSIESSKQAVCSVSRQRCSILIQPPHMMW